MTIGMCARRACLAGVVALVIPLSVGQAQGRYHVPDLHNSSYLGVGYVASIPYAFVGASALGLSRNILGGAGVYADVKFSATSPSRESYYDPNTTVDQAQNQYGDFLLDERSAWLTMNLALVYAVTPELGVYGGAGYSREHHYREYFDASQTRGLAGFYWVADTAASGNRVNALGGLLLRAGRHILFQVGLEAHPQGADVGAIIALPR